MAEKEYIEREAIAKHIDQSFGEVSTPLVVREIRKFPTADVTEVKHGEWIDSDISAEKYVCSICGGACWYYDYHGDVAKSRYCPNCGAKMDGKEKDNAVHR